MTATQINTGMVQVIEWRVELTYLGDPIAVDNNVVAAIGSSIMALGAAHQNSLWRENADHTGLTHRLTRAPCASKKTVLVCVCVCVCVCACMDCAV